MKMARTMSLMESCSHGMSKKCLGLLMLIPLVSCHIKDNKDAVLAFFGDSSNLLAPSDSIRLDLFGIVGPEEIIPYQDALIIKKKSTENHIDIILPEEGVIHCVNRGRGPGELINVGSLQLIGDTLLVFGVSQQMVLMLDLAETIATRNQVISKVLSLNNTSNALSSGFSRAYYLQSGLGRLFATGMFDNGAFYSEISSEGEPLSFVYSPLSIKMVDNLSQQVLNTASSLSISPDGTKISSAYSHIAALSFSTVDSTLTESWSKVFYEPSLWFLDKGGRSVGYKKDNKAAFYAQQACNDCVVLLYSGHTDEDDIPSFMCSNLLVLNWAGEPISRFTLDRPINQFHIKDNLLYGVAQQPDPRVYIFPFDYSYVR